MLDYRQVRRRSLFSALLLALTRAVAASAVALRGQLSQTQDAQPALRLSSGAVVPLRGDEPTLGVLRDKRLAGSDFEVRGQRHASGGLTVEPIHTRSLFVHRGGKRLAVTYWCDICYIRTYTPGICWCCQEETRLDPISPNASATEQTPAAAAPNRSPSAP